MNNIPEYKSELTTEDVVQLGTFFSSTMSRLGTLELTEEDFRIRKAVAAEFRYLVGASYNQFSERIGVDRIIIRAYFFGYLEPSAMEPITQILKSVAAR